MEVEEKVKDQIGKDLHRTMATEIKKVSCNNLTFRLNYKRFKMYFMHMLIWILRLDTHKE